MGTIKDTLIDESFFLSKYGYRTSDKVPHNLSRGWTFELLLEKTFCDSWGYLTVFGLACNNYYNFLPLSPHYEPIVVDDKSKHVTSQHFLDTIPKGDIESEAKKHNVSMEEMQRAQMEKNYMHSSDIDQHH